MRVCLFGTYNRQHAANLIYAEAIRASGCELVEIHEPLWETTRDKDRAYFSPLGLLRLSFSWLGAAVRLSRRWFASGGAPVAVVGFNGQLDVLLLRLLSPRHGPRIVFAPLVTLTETLVDDRGQYPRGSLGQRLLTALDRLTLRAADVVVADTHAHRRYMIDVLGADAGRVAVCHLGVDNAAFTDGREQADADDLGAEDEGGTGSPKAVAPAGRKLEVLYFGQYQPLHGLDVMVDAVGRLSAREDLRFVFIGSGAERPRLERHLRATRADVEMIDWVDYQELGRRVAGADIVLGTFGASVKARMVIANKVYEAAAVGKAVITGDTPAVREIFEDGTNIVLCDATGADLAAAVARLADDADARERLGAAAAALVRERFDRRTQGRVWGALLGDPRMAEEGAAEPRVGVAILSYNDADSTLRCLDSLAHSTYSNAHVLVVDNGSDDLDRRRLEIGMAERAAARSLWLDENLGYAGGNNAAMRTLFSDGCDYVLILNDDTLVTPDAIEMLVSCARANPADGPLGPRVADGWPGGRVASLGERYWLALLWLPRSLLRYRRPRQRAYRVGGVMGCAMLVSRALYDRVGEFDESFFAYYEEVDYCLRARRTGMRARVEPGAEIAHRGHRGFGSGMTETSAYLKARNLWRLGETGLPRPAMVLFAPGYFAMIAASMLSYLLRGRGDVVTAMAAGVSAGMRGETGPPPAVKRGDGTHA